MKKQSIKEYSKVRACKTRTLTNMEQHKLSLKKVSDKTKIKDSLHDMLIG